MSPHPCQILTYNLITNVYVQRSCSYSEVSVRSQSAPVKVKGLRSSLKLYFVLMEPSKGLHFHLRNLHKTHQPTVWLLVQRASVKEASQFSWKDSLEMKPGPITCQLNASLRIKKPTRAVDSWQNWTSDSQSSQVEAGVTTQSKQGRLFILKGNPLRNSLLLGHNSFRTRTMSLP